MFVGYAIPPRSFVSRAPNFQDSFTTPPSGRLSFVFFNIHLLLPFLKTIELPFVFVCLCRQLRTIVHKFMYFFHKDITITASVVAISKIDIDW